MSNIQFGNYVKFIKGTEASWLKLDESQKSADTLYFISDDGSSFGKLYLGSKLISNGSLTSATSLKDLNDILFEENITDQSILIYNLQKQVWENKSILDVFIEINAVFKGASSTSDGSIGFVPVPKAGEQNLFLRGDATWANPVAVVEKDLQTIQNTLNVIVGEDIGVSIREVAQAEANAAVIKIVDGAPEQFDTLKELATWINDNPGVADIGAMKTKITNLEDIINGTETTTGLQVVVSNLQKKSEEHSTAIANIQAALTWQSV